MRAATAWGVLPRADPGPTTGARRGRKINAMSSSEIRERLLQLARERIQAEAAGLDEVPAYMHDLDEEVMEWRRALVEAAVTEIAVLRGRVLGRTFG